MDIEAIRLERHGQRLGVLPERGGGIAAWQVRRPDGTWLDLWRPWDRSADGYRMASFAMVPWSNRIGGGGFEQDGRFHPIAPNRAGEPYPLHGNGWLQRWHGTTAGDDTFELRLHSDRHGGIPHAYEAVQRLRLSPGALHHTVEVRHLGDAPLPYGLGLHPWFPKTPRASVTAHVGGAYLSGADPMPTGHTTTLPDGWDLNRGIGSTGPFIDNAFDGWDGRARLAWPDHGLTIELEAKSGVDDRRAPVDHCLVYRAAGADAFCFEPVTHPIDAFHQPGRPGLVVLERGEILTLDTTWRYRFDPPGVDDDDERARPGEPR